MGVALTRRTAAFGEIAISVEELLRAAGVEVPARVVDEALRERLDEVAAQMRITDRTALRHASADLPAVLAAQIQNQIPGPAMMRARKRAARSHLRLVPDVV